MLKKNWWHIISSSRIICCETVEGKKRQIALSYLYLFSLSFFGLIGFRGIRRIGFAPICSTWIIQLLSLLSYSIHISVSVNFLISWKSEIYLLNASVSQLKRHPLRNTINAYTFILLDYNCKFKNEIYLLHATSVNLSKLYIRYIVWRMSYDIIVVMREHGAINTRTRIEKVDQSPISFHGLKITLLTFLYGNLPLG